MILKSIETAYKNFKERNFDKIYWCIDLHGTCLKNTYNETEFVWINQDVVEALKLISSRKECALIIWSSSHEKYISNVNDFFKKHNIQIDYINQNPEVENTKTGCFDKKFYLSIGVDDKFGFVPEVEWNDIINFYKNICD